jgi:tRNA (mo5U34)-methyltransferase
MKAWCDELERALGRLELDAWREPLMARVRERLVTHPHGDLPRWSEALSRLPPGPAPVEADRDAVTVGEGIPLEPRQHQELLKGLQGLMPWRKGPFRFFGEYLDTEWRSDWKWNRIAPHLADLSGRRVLDVGCGNGYHLWRMLGAGAGSVLGLDPSPLFLMQFLAVKRFAPEATAWLASARLEELPEGVTAFDTVFSLGVLYHRRSPLEHIQQLKSSLRPGGELVLETLVVDGDETTVLMPRGRYAAMRNVWFIPSVAQLEIWLARCGLEAVRCVDCTVTTTDEQRPTDWMTFHSLPQFLDPDDRGRTREGYPAPARATLIARRPG